MPDPPRRAELLARIDKLRQSLAAANEQDRELLSLALAEAERELSRLDAREPPEQGAAR